jgi:hypothetical protein
MNNIISVFKGINPLPSGEVEWPEVLNRIQSERYLPLIKRCRELVSDPVEYRKYKVNLPAVTFCGNFTKNRNCQNILAATGFIIPDLDHLPDVEKTFQLLSQDEYIWFCFRSPSGEGLKCALRAEGIKTDEDIKIFYNAVERYFSSTYGIKIDSACKDIARLTFVSYDPRLFISNNPAIFPIQAWAKQKEQRFYLPVSTDNGWKSKYGLKVLESACEKIRQSVKGEQHRERLKQSRLVGGFIASAFIDEQNALLVLEQAVKDSGAKIISQAMETVRDGIAYGKQSPIQPEEREHFKKKDDIEFYCDPDEVFGKTYHDDNDDNDDNADNDDFRRQHDDTDDDTHGDSFRDKTDQKVYNLAAEIKIWLENSTGSFTSDQIDREFCLVSRRDKQNRSRILARACACAFPQIKKHKNIPGKYEIIDKSLNTIDIFNVSEEPFDIHLPFQLHQFCSLPKKCIVVLAGSGNAGKTAIALNIAKLNLHRPYKKYYLASEMGGGEIVDRLRRFKDIPFCDWGQMTIAERSHDFASVVEAHNPDGLTFVDYLEEIDGEYNKITSQIRAIYDALGNGVAIIGIQKRTDQDFARGGQGTAEKSRLYVSVDTITVIDNQPICAIKIIKMKRWKQRNLNFHELHFKIIHGAEIEVLNDWMILKPGERERYKGIYESKNPERKKEQVDKWLFTFKTVSGKLVGVDHETFEAWQETYSNINLTASLTRISQSSMKNAWLKDKWIWQLIGMLEKENNK